MKKTFRIILICLLVLALIAGGCQVWYLWRTPKDYGTLSLLLSGGQEFYLEYGNPYREPGAQAQHTIDSTVTDIPVKVSGSVNIHRTGSYMLKYTAKVSGIVRTDYRRVHIVDTTAPVIELTVNPDAYTLPNQTYREEGFFAWDNYDGDITDRVSREEKDGMVVYSVTDSSGNTATASRTIRYYDPALPDLQLLGNTTAYIIAGEDYAEPGFTAKDKYDGDLTSAVSVSGSVDPQIPGIYSIEYSVTNGYGNTAKAQRTVYVIPKNEDAEEEPDNGAEEDKPSDGTEEEKPTGGTVIEPNGKVIYLTFDDGPSAHTGKLLDILAKYNVKATFFVVQSSHMDMVTRAAQEGHTVAIHTYSHNYSQIYANDSAFMADLQAIQKVIHQYTGQQTMLTRFPGGSSNTISSAYNRGIMSRLTKSLPAQGYRYFDWNVDSDDAGRARTAEEVFQNVVNGIGDMQTSIVLQHDTKDYSIAAVEQIIAWGLCNGYTFKPLSYDSPGCHHPVLN